MEYYLMTFENTQGAISAEKVTIDQKIKAVIMPTPTHITKSCGLSLKLEKEEINRIEELIRKDIIKYKKIYIKKDNEFQEVELVI